MCTFVRGIRTCKKQMVQLYENGKSRADLVEEYGLTASALDRWIKREVIDWIQLAQSGDRQAEAELIERYEPLINKYSRQDGKLNKDCGQQLVLEFILAVRRFDLTRYDQ